MKEFKNSQLIAKNLPTGSYAAGCPAKEWSGLDKYSCRRCELTQ